MSGRPTFGIRKKPMTTFDLPGLGRRVLLCAGRDPSRHRDLIAVLRTSHEL
jgi:hypothetical protein